MSKSALLVFLAAVVILFIQLGDNSLPSQDDAYHAQTAKEMLQTGDFIGIRFSGTLSFQSSPLPNWLMVLSYKAFGVNEYAARLHAAMLGFLTVVMVYLFVRRRAGERVAVAASFILITTVLFVRYARHSMAEVPVAFFFTLAIFAAVKAMEGARPWWLLFGAATGLAILTKSAIGLLPGVIVVAWLIFTGRFKTLFSPLFLAGSALALLIAASWYLPVFLLYPDAFISSHFGDYLATHVVKGHHVNMGWLGMFHYFIWLPIQYLPWTLALIPAIWLHQREETREKRNFLLVLAILVPMIILSLITTKYTRYLIIVFPSAAALIAFVLWPMLKEKWRSRWLWLQNLIAMLMILYPIVLPVQVGAERNDEIRELAPVIKEQLDPGYEVMNFRLDHWQYQSPLLFYTDHSFTAPIDTVEELLGKLAQGDTRLVLTDKEHLPYLRDTVTGEYSLEVVASADHLVCLNINRMSDIDWFNEVLIYWPLLQESDDVNRLSTFRINSQVLRMVVKRDYKLGLRVFDELKETQLEKIARREGAGVIVWKKDRELVEKLASPDFDAVLLARGELTDLLRIVEVPGRR